MPSKSVHGEKQCLQPWEQMAARVDLTGWKFELCTLYLRSIIIGWLPPPPLPPPPPPPPPPHPISSVRSFPLFTMGQKCSSTSPDSVLPNFLDSAINDATLLPRQHHGAVLSCDFIDAETIVTGADDKTM